MDYPPKSTDICTRKNGGCTSMPWRFQKYGEPTHRKTMLEHLLHRGTNRTSTKRRKEKEYIEKGRKQSSAPGKKWNKYQGQQDRGYPKKPSVIHPWSTELEEVLQKPSLNQLSPSTTSM